VGLVERGILGQLWEVEGTGLRIVVQEVHVLHLLVESPLSCLNLVFRLLEENATIDSTMPLRIIIRKGIARANAESLLLP
jgi:hypothetical protein